VGVVWRGVKRSAECVLSWTPVLFKSNAYDPSLVQQFIYGQGVAISAVVIMMISFTIQICALHAGVVQLVRYTSSGSWLRLAT